MAHDHSHDDPQAYYVEQLCTIGITGVLGGIAVMMFQRGRLWFLAGKIQPWVLAGGILLLVVVAIRAAVVWMQAGRTPAEPDHHDHDHDHEHGHDHSHGGDCGHDHEHEHSHAHGPEHDHSHGGDCDHEHEHSHTHGAEHDHSHGGDGHEHGSGPWRYVILLLPVVLFFLGLPDKSKATADDRDAIQANLDVQTVAEQAKGQVFEVDFPELQRAPATQTSRDFYEGKTIRVKGQFLPGNDRMFTLVRYRQNCCARDAIPLKAVILIDPKSTAKLPVEELRSQWLQVEGQLQFRPNPTQPDVWLTVIVLQPDETRPLFDSTGQNGKALIKVVPADANYYLSW